MTWLTLTASALLAMADSIVTFRRLKWELNPLVTWLKSRTSPTLSVVLGVFLLQALWAVGLYHFAPSILLVFVGCQLHRTYLQYLSRNFNLPEWDAKPLPSLRQNTKTDAPPPSGSNHSGASHEQGSIAVENIARFRRFINSTALKPC